MYTFTIRGDQVAGIPIRRGEQGPGFYLDNVVIPVKGVLEQPFPEGSEDVREMAVAELVDGEQSLFFRKAKDRVINDIRRGRVANALVHVPYEGKLYSAMFGEKVITGPHGARVVRDYLNIEDAEGLSIIDLGSDGILANMTPNSSFRIHKDDKHTNLVVSWTGKELKVFKPKQAGGGTSRNRRRNRRRNEAFGKLGDLFSS